MSQLVVTVETKTAEEPDSQATTLSGAITTRKAEVAVGQFSGFKELVRFHYEVQIATYDFFAVHFRMLPPMWQCNQLEGSLEQGLKRALEVSY